MSILKSFRTESRKSKPKSQVTFQDLSTPQHNPKKSIQLDFIKNTLEKDPDVEIVQGLEYWVANRNIEALKRMNTARLQLQRKLDQEDIVELAKIKRKGFDSSDKIEKEKIGYFKNFEYECIEHFKQIQSKLNKTIQKRDAKRASQLNLKNEIFELQQQLEFIEKYIRISSSKSLFIKMSQENIAVFLNKKQGSINNIKNEKIEILQKIEMIQIDVNKKEKKLKGIEEKIYNLRKTFKIIKNDMITNFLELLKKGVDTKGEGLYTIVKFLLEFGVNIKYEMFPDNLDEITMNSKKHMEVDMFYEDLSIYHDSKHTQSTEREDIHQRLAKLTKTIKIRKPDYSKKYTKWLGEEKILDDVVSNCSESIKLEEKITRLKQEIKNILIEEVRRLTRDCLKTNKDPKKLISFVVGRDNVVKFNILILKELQNLKQIKEQTKTFSFTQNLLPKKNFSMFLKS
ncbi:hypothetical protein SteCoe_20363 [Stentor coeruleus]|uniref:DUF4200 domain-containing protein n=1 Tax=Stentor coeruleus TaxID=5963 RepID=A0A1R2BS04_9CILI|nr:hypothetical protein SteCoe_20363 [Stentor coeruleus]